MFKEALRCSGMSFVNWALGVELPHLCWSKEVHRSQLWASQSKRKKGRGFVLESRYRLECSDLCSCQKREPCGMCVCVTQRLFLCLEVRGNKEEHGLDKNQ